MTVIYLILGCITFLMVYFIAWRVSRSIEQFRYVKNHEKIITMFTYFCQQSFDLIYKDQILSHDASGYKVTDNDLESSRRNYIRMVLELMGKNNKNLFIRFYGSETTLISNIIFDFNARIENNEISNFIRQQQAEA